jgi:hypothetical protein
MHFDQPLFRSARPARGAPAARPDRMLLVAILLLAVALRLAASLLLPDPNFPDALGYRQAAPMVVRQAWNALLDAALSGTGRVDRRRLGAARDGHCIIHLGGVAGLPACLGGVRRSSRRATGRAHDGDLSLFHFLRRRRPDRKPVHRVAARRVPVLVSRRLQHGGRADRSFDSDAPLDRATGSVSRVVFCRRHSSSCFRSGSSC